LIRDDLHEMADRSGISVDVLDSSYSAESARFQ
jgi:hypothetical protein